MNRDITKAMDAYLADELATLIAGDAPRPGPFAEIDIMGLRTTPTPGGLDARLTFRGRHVGPLAGEVATGTLVHLDVRLSARVADGRLVVTDLGYDRAALLRQVEAGGAAAPQEVVGMRKAEATHTSYWSASLERAVTAAIAATGAAERTIARRDLPYATEVTITNAIDDATLRVWIYPLRRDCAEISMDLSVACDPITRPVRRRALRRALVAYDARVRARLDAKGSPVRPTHVRAARTPVLDQHI